MEILLPRDQDEIFFSEHPGRKIRIRLPEKGKRIGETEFEKEFRTLGPHSKKRRRIIVATVDPQAARMYGLKDNYMRIPYLVFADEEIADADEILLPILYHEMLAAAQHYGMPVRRRG